MIAERIRSASQGGPRKFSNESTSEFLHATGSDGKVKTVYKAVEISSDGRDLVVA